MFDPSTLPLPLAGLFAGKQLLAHLTAEDLREMAKFTEQPNLAGLAAHAIERPAPAERNFHDLSDPADLPARMLQALDRGTIEFPTIVIQGTVGPNRLRIADCGLQSDRGVEGEAWQAEPGDDGVNWTGAPVVQYLVPQTQAHLAQALQMILWPAGRQPGSDGNENEPSTTPIYTLLHWPEPPRAKNGASLAASLVAHWPERGLGLIIGHDDPRLPLRLLLDAARLAWSRQAQPPRLVPPGTGYLSRENAPAGGSAAARFIPLSPEATPAERVAAQEPLLVLEDHAATSQATTVWRNPLLPAGLLGYDPAWRTAALAVGALPLGVALDDEGRFPLLHGGTGAKPESAAPIPADAEAEAGWVVVPREAIPAPFARQA